MMAWLVSLQVLFHVQSTAAMQLRPNSSIFVERSSDSWEKHLLREGTGDAAEYQVHQEPPQYPQCTCSCCFGSRLLRESAVTGPSPIKCARAPEGHSLRCMDVCFVTPSDSILGDGTNKPVHYSRFCFYECQPPGGASGSTSALEPCSPLHGYQIQAANSADGQGGEVR